MNEEIGNFVVKFVTEGLDDIKAGLKDLNKNVETLSDTMEKAGRDGGKGDSFFKALVKWTGLVGGLTAAFVELKRVINGVFDTSESVIDIYGKEQTLGVEAKVLEQYGIISRRNQGSQADAYAFFNDVNEMMFKFQKNRGLSDELMMKYADVNFDFSYDYNKDLAANRAAYIDALRRSVQGYYNNPNEAIQSQLKDLVKQESFLRAFAADDAGWQKLLAWGDKWRAWTVDEDTLDEAQRLKTVTMEWEQIWAQIETALIPILSDLLEALEPLKEPIMDLVAQLKVWVGNNKDNIAKNVESAVKWLVNEFPKKLEALVEVLGLIGKVVSDIYDWMSNKGVVGKTWDAIKGLYEGAKLEVVGITEALLGGDGSQTAYEKGLWQNKLMSGEYGYLSSLHGYSPVTNNTTNNNGSTYVLKAGDHHLEKDVILNGGAPTGGDVMWQMGG